MKLLKCEKVSDNNYIMEISVPKEDFFNEIEKVYKRNVKKFNVPGFRKGKAPKSIIERRYGNNIFWDEAINNLYPEAYMQAAKEANLSVVNTEKVEVVSVDIDNGFTFKVECVVEPEVEVGQYKDLPVIKNIRFATDEDVDNEIERIRRSYARTIDIVDRGAEDGDNVIIDFEGTVDGKVFEGGKGENYTLTLGSHNFIPGFEEQIIGHKVGEEFDIKVNFPKEYNNKDLAGKEAVFNIILHEIKKIELPDLDDEFVKDISEFDNINDFREDVKKSIKLYKDNQSAKEVENKLVDKIVSSIKTSIPKVMIERRIKDLQRDFEENLKKQGITLENYLKYTKQKIEDLKKIFEPEANRSVKLRLGLKKIAKLEDFVVSEDDIKNFIEEMSKIHHMAKDKIEKIFDRERIIEDIKIDKAINLIKETANVKEVIEAEKEDKDKKENKNKKESKDKKEDKSKKEDEGKNKKEK